MPPTQSRGGFWATMRSVSRLTAQSPPPSRITSGFMVGPGRTRWRDHAGISPASHGARRDATASQQPRFNRYCVSDQKEAVRGTIKGVGSSMSPRFMRASGLS